MIFRYWAQIKLIYPNTSIEQLSQYTDILVANLALVAGISESDITVTFETLGEDVVVCYTCQGDLKVIAQDEFFWEAYYAVLQDEIRFRDVYYLSQGTGLETSNYEGFYKMSQFKYW